MKLILQRMASLSISINGWKEGLTVFENHWKKSHSSEVSYVWMKFDLIRRGKKYSFIVCSSFTFSNIVGPSSQLILSPFKSSDAVLESSSTSQKNACLAHLFWASVGGTWQCAQVVFPYFKTCLLSVCDINMWK